jgi:hypothetical protein
MQPSRSLSMPRLSSTSSCKATSSEPAQAEEGPEGGGASGISVAYQCSIGIVLYKDVETEQNLRKPFEANFSGQGRKGPSQLMPTALDNDQRSPRKLPKAVVARVIASLRRS